MHTVTAFVTRDADACWRVFTDVALLTSWVPGLRRAEIPSLRRIRAQEFAFRPGVDVSEIRQAKGLEFDYVVLVDVNANTFGIDDESRHLFHIGATRAAHQLWLIVTGTPSRLLPSDLRPG